MGDESAKTEGRSVYTKNRATKQDANLMWEWEGEMRHSRMDGEKHGVIRNLVGGPMET